MAPVLPAPEDDGNSQAHTQHGGNRRRQRRENSLPDVKQITQMLLQLNSAVITGVISIKKANLIQRNLRTILDMHLKREGRVDSGPGYDALVELCRRDPTVIDVLEPFLTDEAFDLVMKGIAEPSGEST